MRAKRTNGVALGQVALVAFLASAFLASPVMASGGGEKAEGGKSGGGTHKSRLDATSMPGAFVQLAPIWVPIKAGTQKPVYVGIALRLFPEPEKRYEACLNVPVVVDGLIRHFYRTPLTPELYDNALELRKVVQSQIVALVGKGVYSKIEFMQRPEMPDKDSGELSALCR